MSSEAKPETIVLTIDALLASTWASSLKLAFSDLS
jgi:hypothetical protein